MKKVIMFSCIFMFSLFNIQCSFLDEKPIDRLVVDNFYSNQKDAQAAVDATYQQLHSIYNRHMYMLCDLTCDGMKNGLGMPNAFCRIWNSYVTLRKILLLEICGKTTIWV